MPAIHELLDPRYILLDCPAQTDSDAISAATKLLKEDADMTDASRFCDAVLARERLCTTAVGHELAFPHARTDCVRGIVVAAARCAAPVPFGPDHLPVRFLFVIGTPMHLVREYLALLGKLARILKAESVRAQLAEAPTPREFLRVLQEINA